MNIKATIKQHIDKKYSVETSKFYNNLPKCYISDTLKTTIRKRGTKDWVDFYITQVVSDPSDFCYELSKAYDPILLALYLLGKKIIVDEDMWFGLAHDEKCVGLLGIIAGNKFYKLLKSTTARERKLIYRMLKKMMGPVDFFLFKILYL